MHDYTMGKIGKYIKENYCPEKMTRCDLEELYCWSKIFHNLLAGDQAYNIVESMEEGENKNEMTVEEFIPRFTRMYNMASPTEQSNMRTRIMNIIS